MVDKSSQETLLRLQVFLSKAGVGSRRKCEEYIELGKVKVNGRIVKKQGIKVSLEDEITYNGRRVYLAKKKIYLALNKPPGFVCSNKDPEGRPLAIDLIKSAYTQRLFHVGRLDLQSSGLIFYSNDGEFGEHISHPRYSCEKEYLVETNHPFPENIFEPFLKGVRINNIKYKITDFSFKNKRTVYITLNEGKNREIRNIFQYLKIKIKKLHRVRIGNVTIKGLAPGRFRTLTQKEINFFIKPE
jgi:23S rRNA pseudouridine2605 synthase